VTTTVVCIRYTKEDHYSYATLSNVQRALYLYFLGALENLVYCYRRRVEKKARPSTSL